MKSLETWINLGIGAAVIIFITYMGVGLYQMEQKWSNETKKEIEDCVKLDARYLDTYKVKTGPYRDIEMSAVEFGQQSIGLTTKYGNDDTIRRFRCGDVYHVESN